jgi:hypothetical protein
MRYIQTLLLAAVLSISATSCKTVPANGDSFYEVVVTCTMENSSNPQAGAAVLGCFTGAIGGDYTACLSGLVAAGNWTIEEIACVVRAYATTSAQRINAGKPEPTDADVLKKANAWIRDHKVGYR